ncbi:MAG: LptF/LptG family permease [Bacteroidales bacterium]
MFRESIKRRLKLKRLHYFILKSFFTPLLLTFFIVIFLLQMQFLWKYVDDLVGKGLSIGVLAELLLYASATFVPLALPLAILLASLMTFGNLGENYELTALKASGISLWQIMYPLILLMGVVSILAFFYSNVSLPYYNLKFRSLLFDIQQHRPELQIKEGIYYNGVDGYTIKIGKKNYRTNMLYQLKIYDHTQNMGNTSVTVADSGTIKVTADNRTLIITLYNGESYVDMPEERRRVYAVRSYPFRRDRFKQQIITIPLEGFDFQRTQEELFRNNYQMMNLSQLKYSIDSMNREITGDVISLKSNLAVSNLYPVKIFNSVSRSAVDTLPAIKDFRNVRFLYYYLFNKNSERSSVISMALSEARSIRSTLLTEAEVRRSKMIRMRKHEIEWHKKFTLSLACLIFFFIGAPLGAIIRKGGFGLPLVISVVFFVLYYIVSLTGEKMARESFWPTWQGVWLASMVLLPVGIFLTIKATNDSVVFNLDFYYRMLNRIKDFFSRLFGNREKFRITH